jgi:hypothetical protein
MKPKVGDRMKWIGQAGVRIDYGTVVRVSTHNSEYDILWDNPDEDTGEALATYDYLNTASSVRPA